MTSRKRAGLAWALVIILAGLIVAVTVDKCLKGYHIIECEDCT